MRKIILVLLTLSIGMSGCTDETPREEAEKLAVADAMIDAWNRMDWERAFGLFADDGVLHSVMNEPVVGRDVITERLTALVGGLERIELEIINKGIVGDVVVLERVDDFVYKGRHSRVPVVGVMEISDGKIDEWREYYDKASLVAALSPATPGAVEDEIRELTRRLSTDWNAGNMAAYLAAYDDGAELSLLFGNRVVAGKQAMVDLFTSSWTTEAAMGDFDTDRVGVRLIAPGIAVARGLFEHRFPDETIHGAFSHVWRQSGNGAWKIVHEHTSRGAVE